MKAQKAPSFTSVDGGVFVSACRSARGRAAGLGVNSTASIESSNHPRGRAAGPKLIATFEQSRYRRRRALVRAAFLAAAERVAEPFVRTAFRAAAERAEAVRREAARRVCFESAARDAVLRGSRLRARDTARETRGRRLVLRLPWPAS